MHLRGADLPDPAHGGVEHGLSAATIGRAFRGLDQCRGLRLQQWESQCSDAVHPDHRQWQGQGAMGAELAGPLDAGKH